MAKTEIMNTDALTLRVAEDGAIEKTLEAAEKAMDVLERKIDVIEETTHQLVTVTKNNPLIVAGAFVVGVVIGGAVTWKFVSKRLELKYEAELSEQITQAKEFHSRLAKTDEFATPESAVEALVPAKVIKQVEVYQGRRDSKIPYNQVAPKPEIVVVEKAETTVINNVFEAAKPDPRDWDYRLEVADREANPDHPYVISFEEFTESDNDQNTLVYYVGDDTLCDSRDQPLDDTDVTVGEDNLQRFGHGSNDRNVVYVRNEKHDMDFEIVRSDGSYKKDVLGFTDESMSLRHSRRSGSRRGRSADE